MESSTQIRPRSRQQYGQPADVSGAGSAARDPRPITRAAPSPAPSCSPSSYPAAAQLRAASDRSLSARIARHLRGTVDRLIAASSLVPNDPVLDVRLFPWTQMLRDHWEEIRAEALRVALHADAAPSLPAISPEHRAIAPADQWRSFILWGYGYRISDNAARCPATSALVQQVPGLTTACFSILAPGTHVPARRGVSKGLITCHLGLVVPRGGDARMRVDRRVVRWCEGETLVFDDTYDHEVWNDTDESRVVLLIQFARPLRHPGKWIADRVLAAVRRSRFVQETGRTIAAWNAARRIDA